MASFAFPDIAKKATLSDGTTYGYIHIPPSSPSKPTFLLLHGAPSSSYIWHHQIDLLPKAGFGVIAPDLLGYGDTDRPVEVELYQIHRLVGHLHELVTRVIGVNKVIGVGHDFGSGLLSHTYLHRKDLFTGVIFIAVGFGFLNARFDPDFIISLSKHLVGYSTAGYTKLFISPEGASIVEKHHKLMDSIFFAQDPTIWKEHLLPEGALMKFFEAGKEVPVGDWLAPHELEMHNKILKHSGYTGPLNWYKAAALLDPAKEDVEFPEEEKKITVPTLFILPTKDYVLIHEAQIQSTKAVAPHARVVNIDAGHWAMWEKKEEVERLIEEFGKEVERGG
ncbi:Alpha/Beta hydrolase protein [Podospora australis]|uniref:Alpha/Beta hydrolase protein n=1 Tax=Podospora australis TaxID=1536484 RepID=A0AAN6WIM3_9PEZI|nr:Alpha/Beta hydrolase protein [Podospora australis]